jgi:peroxiredoxin
VSAPPRRAVPSSARALLAVAALLAISAAGGFFLYRLTAPPASTLQAASSSPVGLALTLTPGEERPGQSLRGPAIPDRVPAIALPGLDGKAHTLDDWHGSPLLINFWATWCEPCRREVPLLRALTHERAAQGLQIVGVAIDSHDAVQQFIARLGIDYPVLLGEKDGFAVITAFGMDTVLPFSVFADRSGRIVTLKVGELHRDEADLILDRLQQLDKGRLTLAAAREQISAGVQRLEIDRARHSAS